MSTFTPEDYYPEGKIYEIFGKHVNSYAYREESEWHNNLSLAIKFLEEKLGSPRIKSLNALWYSGFEDRELRKLQKSLLTIRITADDIQREEKELKLWRLQHKHLKDLLCQVDDVMDDISLRAPQLKELFQSLQVRQHPYLTEKLGQINNLIQEFDKIAAEIKSVVLPEFNKLQRKAFHHPDSSARPGVGTSIDDPPSGVPSFTDTLALHFATLNSCLSRIEVRQTSIEESQARIERKQATLSRIEDRQTSIEESQARIERKQASIAENMKVLFDGLTHVCKISGHPLPPLREFDLSDSE